MAAEQDSLLTDAKNGERTALEQLLLKNYDYLMEILSSRIPAPLRSTIDVEDILQMTFIRVFRDFSTFQGTDALAFQAWVRTIANARLVDAIRSATRQKRGGDHKRVVNAPVSASQSFENLLELLSDQQRSPSRSAAAHEAVAALQMAVAELPDDQREAIWLRCIENLALSEVAQAMDRTEDAVRGLLHRGKAALKKAIGNSSAWFSKLE